MKLEQLDYILYKQRDIIGQIITIKQRIEIGIKIPKTIGAPDNFSPQDLITFHHERYHILELAKSCNNERLKKLLIELKNMEPNFRTEADIGLLEGCIAND